MTTRLIHCTPAVARRPARTRETRWMRRNAPQLLERLADAIAADYVELAARDDPSLQEVWATEGALLVYGELREDTRRTPAAELITRVQRRPDGSLPLRAGTGGAYAAGIDGRQVMRSLPERPLPGLLARPLSGAILHRLDEVHPEVLRRALARAEDALLSSLRWPADVPFPTGNLCIEHAPAARMAGLPDGPGPYDTEAALRTMRPLVAEEIGRWRAAYAAMEDPGSLLDADTAYTHADLARFAPRTRAEQDQAFARMFARGRGHRP